MTLQTINIGNGICDDGSGNCTLRAAIQESNATAGTQTINFNISGPADFTNGGQNGYSIKPSSALPLIISTVVINGYSQPGSQANTAVSPNPFDAVLLIEIDGVNAGGDFTFGGSSVDGLKLLNGSSNTEIRGLVINGFSGSGIAMYPGADSVKVAGNYIGTNPNATAAKNNYHSGISTFGTGPGVGGPIGAIIGGLNPSDRNIISGNNSHSNDPSLATGVQGISLTDGSNGWLLQGNYIGVAADGVTAIPNELGGMTIDYVDGLTVGGSALGATNLVSGNGDGGIQPDGCSNIVIQGNYIGTDYTGNGPLPNAHKGISFVGSTDSIIGGVNPGEGNIIAYAGNGDPGIFLNSGSGVNGPLGYPQNISMVGNSIHDNGGLGIDLDFNSTTTNDPNDSDSGADYLINFPEYTNVSEASGNTTVDYRLDVPLGDYRIEYFSNTNADPSGNGEGQTYLGYQDITVTATGLQTYTHTLTGVTGVTNLAMTTTQRNVNTPSGFGATSEFGGEPIPIQDLGIDLTLTDPENVAPGSTVTYHVTITNHGLDPYDINNLTNTAPLQNSLAAFIAPPDLMYAGGVTDPNITCASSGLVTGLPSFYQSFFADHLDAEISQCGYSGPSHILRMGESYSFDVQFTVSNDSDLEFTNIGYIPLFVYNDPDTPAMNAAFSSGQDFITYLGSSINNISYASYPLPPEPARPPSISDADNPSSNNLLQSLLSETGQVVYLIACITSLLLVISIVLFTKKRSRQ